MLRAPLTAVAAVLLMLATTPAVPAGAATTAKYGHTAARDRTLRPGCHNYRYRYVVKAPRNDWTLETFLVDPTGEHLVSGAYLSDSDPRRGHGRFRICRYTTQPGRFTIRAKLHWYTLEKDHKVHFRPAHFRLRRR